MMRHRRHVDIYRKYQVSRSTFVSQVTSVAVRDQRVVPGLPSKHELVDPAHGKTGEEWTADGGRRIGGMDLTKTEFGTTSAAFPGDVQINSVGNSGDGRSPLMHGDEGLCSLVKARPP